jgi:hypothetical protein
MHVIAPVNEAGGDEEEDKEANCQQLHSEKKMQLLEHIPKPLDMKTCTDADFM